MIKMLCKLLMVDARLFSETNPGWLLAVESQAGKWRQYVWKGAAGNTAAALVRSQAILRCAG